MCVASDVIDLVRQTLANSGYYMKMGDDMFEWTARMRHRGQLVNPQYWWPNIKDQSESYYQLIRDGDDELIGTMCWRVLDTDHFVMNEFESGRAFFDDPDAHGWYPYRSGADDIVLSGRCMSRGGIVSWNRGSRISWFLTTVALAWGVLEKVDYSIGMSYPAITAAGIPVNLYGYAHQKPCRAHALPWEERPVALTLLWSSWEEMLEEITERKELLETTYNDDLASVVRAYQGRHVTHKAAAGW